MMRKQRKAGLAIAAAVSILLASQGYAADIGDFLTGGSGGQGQETNMTGGQDMTGAGGQTGSGQDAGSAGGQAGSGQNVAGTSASQALNMVTCTDPQTGLNVARAVVPEGYTVNSETIWCGSIQNPDYPAEVFIDAKSPDGSIQMTYESPIEFIQILNASVNGMQFIVHQDYQVSLDYLTMMLTYMNASQYCDYVSQTCMPGTSGMTLISETPVTQETQAMLDQVSSQKMAEANQVFSVSNGTYVDLVETTTAEKTYRYTDASGRSKILVINCVSQGVRIVEDFTSYGMGTTNIINLVWSIPYRYALMVDEDKYEEGRVIFDSFCTNTTISDQFKKAMADLSQSIMNGVASGSTTTISSQADYVQDSVSSSLSSSDDTYSSMEAWDDAILDRNDYTLSSGDSVKVDTSYDYVYELPDGNVYATNSALDEPAGGTLLYAN